MAGTAARPARATPAPNMLGRPGVVQAVGAPVGVQLHGGHAPHRPLLRVAGHGAEFGHQPARRVQHQRALVDPPPPGTFPRHRALLDAQLGVVGFHPTRVPLLRPAQDAQPLGSLVGLPGRGPDRMLSQRQPILGGRQVPPPSPASRQRRHLLSGGLVVGAGLLSVSGALGGQAQLPRAVRRTLRPEFSEPAAFGAQLGGRPPPHIRHVGGVDGEGLAAVTGQHPRQQLLGRPRLPGRVGRSSSGRAARGRPSGIGRCGRCCG
jgi:hypothetical protein